MKRKAGKVHRFERATDRKIVKTQADGVVDKSTRDELDMWLQNDRVKPIPPLRKNDVDDEGVSRGKGKREVVIMLGSLLGSEPIQIIARGC